MPNETIDLILDFLAKNNFTELRKFSFINRKIRARIEENYPALIAARALRQLAQGSLAFTPRILWEAQIFSHPNVDTPAAISLLVDQYLLLLDKSRGKAQLVDITKGAHEGDTLFIDQTITSGIATPTAFILAHESGIRLLSLEKLKEVFLASSQKKDLAFAELPALSLPGEDNPLINIANRSSSSSPIHVLALQNHLLAIAYHKHVEIIDLQERRSCLQLQFPNARDLRFDEEKSGRLICTSNDACAIYWITKEKMHPTNNQNEQTSAVLPDRLFKRRLLEHPYHLMGTIEEPCYNFGVIVPVPPQENAQQKNSHHSEEQLVVAYQKKWRNSAAGDRIAATYNLTTQETYSLHTPFNLRSSGAIESIVKLTNEIFITTSKRIDYWSGSRRIAVFPSGTYQKNIKSVRVGDHILFYTMDWIKLHPPLLFGEQLTEMPFLHSIETGDHRLTPSSQEYRQYVSGIQFMAKSKYGPLLLLETAEDQINLVENELKNHYITVICLNSDKGRDAHRSAREGLQQRGILK
ncbi:MAG: hypothetical protein KGI80_02355 [Verrucomicrobiota bacterium]|nr:hypothetical protein [Verrucomicrobiota bacterium]